MAQDAKSKLITNVMTRLNSDQTISEDVLSSIESVLYIELNEFNIEEMCTDVAILNIEETQELLKLFLATKQLEGCSPRTLEQYGVQIYKLLVFVGKPVANITAYDIRYYLAHLKSVNHNSNVTLDTKRSYYSSFFTWLFNEGIITQNPMLSVAQIKCKKVVRLPFTSVDLQKLRDACVRSRDRALIEFLYCTGCRVSEVSQVNISDINFEKRECRVTGKGNKERIVYISDIAMLRIQDYLKERSDNLDPLFLDVGTFQRLTKDGIEHVLNRIGERANVEDVYPHRFRRTCATDLLNKGMNIQYVAKILGHEDISTTQIYGYVNQNNIKQEYFRCNS